MSNRKKTRPLVKEAVAGPLPGWLVALLFLLAGLLIWTQGRAADTPLQNPALKALEEDVWTADEKQYPELERRITRIIQENPYSGFGHYLMGHLFIRKYAADPSDMKLLRRASELGQQAIEIKAKEDFGYIVIAEILDIMGQSLNSVRILDKTLNEDIRDSWRTYFLRAKLQADSLPSSQVFELLDLALRQKETQTNVVVPYVVALLRTEFEGFGLVNELDRWNRKFPNSLFLQTKAITLANLEQYRRAHNIYKEIYKSNPTYKEALINDAILLYTKLEQKQEAFRLLERVLKDFQGELDEQSRALVNAHLGIIHLDRKKYKEARQHFATAVTEARNRYEMLDFVSEAYRKRKGFNELTALLQQLNVDLPGQAVFYALLGETLSEGLSDHEKALEAFGDAIALEPERSDFYNGMGLAYYRMEDMGKALNYFSTATKVDPEDATARYNEACALARLGRPDEAIGSLREALALDPRLQKNAQVDRDFETIKKSKQFEQLVSSVPMAEAAEDNKAVISGPP